jgi:hypothetical protein
VITERELGGRVRTYRHAHGITGYRAGDVLIGDDGMTSHVIADASGLALEPAVLDVPIRLIPDPSSIGWRLHPIDVGFDLRSRRVPIIMPATDHAIVSYASSGGDLRVMSGPTHVLEQRLAGAGYLIAAFTDAMARDGGHHE